MTIDLQQLDSHPRLLMEAELKPVQGKRFQPTGFPDLGAATYQVPSVDGSTRVVLVESAQSIANRLEAVCWNEAADELHSALKGMPYVSVKIPLKKKVAKTNSLLEAHRLNSPYFIQDEDFETRLRSEAELPEKRGDADIFDRRALAVTAFKYDPGSVLHGVFLEKLAGVARLQRCLSGFIEACGVSDANSGGVKNDRIARTPDAVREIGLSGGAREGFLNVPFHRTEYTAEKITAYFNLDLAQIRAYGLGENAGGFLVTLALWKIRKFLDTGLRLRTACDLDAGDLEVTRPKHTFTVPSVAELEAELPALIQACASDGLFADPPVTQLTFNRS